jgi:hypothetical protein
MGWLSGGSEKQRGWGYCLNMAAGGSGGGRAAAAAPLLAAAQQQPQLQPTCSLNWVTKEGD